MDLSVQITSTMHPKEGREKGVLQGGQERSKDLMVQKDTLEVAPMMLQTFGKCCKGNLGVGPGKRGQRFNGSCPDRDLFTGPSLMGVKGVDT